MTDWSIKNLVNLVCLVAQDGSPADPGADDLARQGRLSTGIDLVLGRAKVTELGKHILILLSCKRTQTYYTDIVDLLEFLHSRLDVATELDLPTLYISKFSPDEISWKSTRDILIEIYLTTATQILACGNEVIIPPPRRCNDIISENHV